METPMGAIDEEKPFRKKTISIKPFRGTKPPKGLKTITPPPHPPTHRPDSAA